MFSSAYDAAPSPTNSSRKYTTHCGHSIPSPGQVNAIVYSHIAASCQSCDNSAMRCWTASRCARNKMHYGLEVSWIAVAEINGFAPSENTRKHINSL